VEDRQQRFCLAFDTEGVQFIPWPEDQPVDFLLRGKERDFILLFAGEELTYLHAKQQIQTSGPFRDLLKLEALIRLSSAAGPPTYQVERHADIIQGTEQVSMKRRMADEHSFTD
jgi:hypothetical protein